jgi:hypothetical protein
MAFTGAMPSSTCLAESQGKRLFDSAVYGCASRISLARMSREAGPANAKTPHCVVTSWMLT